MFRVIRFFKIFKLFKKSIVFKKIKEFLNLNAGMMRLLGLLLTTIILVHLVGCLWYMIARFDDFSPDTWVAM
jgi:succinate dehydrogenase/fumarate reductase cytochrome b subunit